MRELDQLVSDLLRHGLEIANAGKHRKVKREGETLATIPLSPSDHRTVENLRHDLARAGVLPLQKRGGGGGRGRRPELAPRPYDGPRLAPGRIPRRKDDDDGDA